MHRTDNTKLLEIGIPMKYKVLMIDEQIKFVFSNGIVRAVLDILITSFDSLLHGCSFLRVLLHLAIYATDGPGRGVDLRGSQLVA